MHPVPKRRRVAHDPRVERDPLQGRRTVEWFVARLEVHQEIGLGRRHAGIPLDLPDEVQGLPIEGTGEHLEHVTGGIVENVGIPVLGEDVGQARQTTDDGGRCFTRQGAQQPVVEEVLGWAHVHGIAGRRIGLGQRRSAFGCFCIPCILRGQRRSPTPPARTPLAPLEAAGNRGWRSKDRRSANHLSEHLTHILVVGRREE